MHTTIHPMQVHWVVITIVCLPVPVLPPPWACIISKAYLFQDCVLLPTGSQQLRSWCHSFAMKMHQVDRLAVGSRLPDPWRVSEGFGELSDGGVYKVGCITQYLLQGP